MSWIWSRVYALRVFRSIMTLFKTSLFWHIDINNIITCQCLCHDTCKTLQNVFVCFFITASFALSSLMETFDVIKLINTLHRWKWTTLSPPSSVIFSALHIHWAVARQRNSRSASRTSFTLYLGQSSVLSSPPRLTRCAFAFLNRLSSLPKSRAECMCVRLNVIFISVLLVADKSVIKSLKWPYDENIIWLELKTPFLVKKQISIYSVQVAKTTRSELCKTNESNESEYERTHWYISDVCSVVKKEENRCYYIYLQH